MIVQRAQGIPGHKRMLLPLLRAVRDGKPHTVTEVASEIADHFSIPQTLRVERRWDGRIKLIYRIEWARTYLKKAGLVHYPKPGTFQITSKGKESLGRDLSEANFLKAHFPRT